MESKIMSSDLSIANSITLVGITIHRSGEVDYPDDVSSAARDFWEAVIKMFPDIFRAANIEELAIEIHEQVHGGASVSDVMYLLNNQQAGRNSE